LFDFVHRLKKAAEKKGWFGWTRKVEEEALEGGAPRVAVLGEAELQR
jgi:hypothetical protein